VDRAVLRDEVIAAMNTSASRLRAGNYLPQ
jgi:hypothetical protein